MKEVHRETNPVNLDTFRYRVNAVYNRYTGFQRTDFSSDGLRKKNCKNLLRAWSIIQGSQGDITIHETG